MQIDRSTKRTGRLAPLAQAGLAALVAGSLLTFSTIAFHTAFDEPSRSGGVTVSTPRTAASAPVVLPTPPRPEVARPEEPAVVAAVDATNAPGTLGVRVEPQDPTPTTTKKSRGKTSKGKTSKGKQSGGSNSLSWSDAKRTLSGNSGYSSGDGDGNGKGHGKSQGNSHSKGHDKARGKGHHKQKGHKGHGKRHSGIARG